jgi:multiple sugar transport system ATP-binding protein
VLGIRAEDVRLTAADGVAEGSGLIGEVGLLEPLGSDTYVEVNRGAVAITGRIEPDRRLRLGEKVALQLPRQKLHFFDGATGERLNL